MLTRKMFSSANLCEYDVKQRLKYRLNIVVRCYELNCSFYNADSSNYKRNTIRIFSHISEKYIKFSSFDLSYKKQPETFTEVFFCLLLTTRTKRVSIIPLGIGRGINYRYLFSCSLFRRPVACKC